MCRLGSFESPDGFHFKNFETLTLFATPPWVDGRLRVGEFVEAVRVGDCASATVSKSRFATIALVLPCVIGRDRTPPIVFLRLGLSGDDMFDRKKCRRYPA